FYHIVSFLICSPPPHSPLFPYTTLFRSPQRGLDDQREGPPPPSEASNRWRFPAAAIARERRRGAAAEGRPCARRAHRGSGSTARRGPSLERIGTPRRRGLLAPRRRIAGRQR